MIDLPDIDIIPNRVGGMTLCDLFLAGTDKGAVSTKALTVSDIAVINQEKIARAIHDKWVETEMAIGTASAKDTDGEEFLKSFDTLSAQGKNKRLKHAQIVMAALSIVLR